MKFFSFLLLLSTLLLAADVSDISFTQAWDLTGGGIISVDTLVISGESSKYKRATLAVSVPSTTKNIYFVASVFLDQITTGVKSHEAPKFKVYDNRGKAIQAFNMPALIQGEWYTTGMVIKNFDKLGISSISVEFGLQNCLGDMKIHSPKLLDEAPTSTYEFPFDVPGDNSCTIKIESDKKAPFVDELLSVNSHFVWASSGWDGSDVTRVLEERLSLGNLRFPGGTVGNFYDWESDGFYGDEWTFLSPSRKKAYEDGFRFGFTGFADRCKETNASATLMFNVIKDTPQKAKSRLENRLAAGLDIGWIELGNENFFTEQSFGNVETIDAYISHTKEVTTQLKSVDPSIKVGVNLNHHDFSDGSWNVRLSEEDFFDVAIIHPYVQTNSFMLNRYSAKVMLSAYKKTQDRIDEYVSHFPNHPVIFTEWSILSEGTPPNFVQALAIGDMFLSIIEGADRGVVKQAGIHMLYHSDNYNEATLYYKDGGEFKRTRLGVLYEKISKVFFGNNLYSALGSSAELEEGLQSVNGRAVEVGDSIKIFVVNKTPEDSKLHIEIDGIAYAGEYTVESFRETIGGESNGYSFSDNPWTATSGTGAPTLSAYAIHVVTIPKKESALLSQQKSNTATYQVVPRSKGVLISGTSKQNISLFSLRGELLENVMGSKSALIGTELATGLYLLQFGSGAQRVTERIWIP